LKNRNYMELALKIAFERMGKTSPNPPVGAVIVKDDLIIATGGTGPFGSSHAETVAIKAAGGTCAGTDLYVSLEPCNHYGKTPPCTAAIIRAGIARVFVPALDPNPLVSGKGVAELEKAGVEVVFMEDMAGLAVDVIRPFHKYIMRHRPFVLSKSAVTLDGRIAAKTGDSRWISSDYSRYLTHRLRSKVDAIVIGKNTFTSDNPSLNVRLDSFSDEVVRFFNGVEPAMMGRENFLLKSLFGEAVTGPRDPLRIVIGLPEKIDPACNIMADDNYLFFECREKAEGIVKSWKPAAEMLAAGRLHLVDAATPVEEVRAVAEELARRGVMFVLLEGGGGLAGSFLDAGEIDQFLYIITPRIAGAGVPPISGIGVDTIADSLVLRDVSMMPVKEDLIYTGYREPYHFEMM
jgi:diaminohydroxyphosphoribosylaminopyrimidine deaminase / 5-amino-6-(5-phosphoribosylamino)uracil reductase